MHKCILFFCFLLSFTFISCKQIPDDKAKVVIENECSEFCYFDKVWYKDSGELLGWKLIWDEGDDDFHPRYATFYMDEGSYDFKIRVYGYGVIPIEYRTGLFSSVELVNGCETSMYFDGVSLNFKQ